MTYSSLSGFGLPYRQGHAFCRIESGKRRIQLVPQGYQHLVIDAPKPDLVIYLQAPTRSYCREFRNRIPSEQMIESEYLNQLNRAYTEFFHYYSDSKLLIVNSAEIDLVANDEDYDQLVTYILSLPNGTHYFNPNQLYCRKVCRGLPGPGAVSIPFPLLHLASLSRTLDPMSTQTQSRNVTLTTLQKIKEAGQKFACLTAYDYQLCRNCQ